MSEYWIDSTGSVTFADGNVADINHEGVVIEMIQQQIMDKFPGNYDWEHFKEAIARKHADDMIAKNPRTRKSVEAALEDDPERFATAAVSRAGVKKVEWRIAHGLDDARDFAMKMWGWKTYRDENVDTWLLRASDIKAIIRGISEISEDEGWSDRKLARMRFTITVFASGKSFHVTLAQLQNPRRPSMPVPQFDYLSQQANKQARERDVMSQHPFYRGRDGAFGGGGVINTLGDSVLSFRAFMDDNN